MAEAETPDGESLSIPSVRDGSPRRFENPAAFQRFVEELRSPWEWLRNQKVNLAPISAEWKSYDTKLRDAHRLVSAVAAVTDADERKGTLRKVGSLVDEALSSRFNRTMTLPRREWIDRVRDSRSAEDAVHVANTWLGGPPDSPVAADALPGALLAVLFDIGAIDRISAEEGALTKASAWWAGFQQDARARLAALTDEVDEFARETRAERLRQTETFTQLTSESTDRLEDLKKTYEEKLALRAPVTYWTDKAAAHLRRSKDYGRWFSELLILFAAVFAIEIVEFWNLGEEARNATQLAPWQTVILLATATVFFWPLRILARMLLANAHLRADADERATMVNTYLSLVREGREMPDQDRALILGALFRPSVTGIVRDEGMPPSIAGAVSRFTAGRI